MPSPSSTPSFLDPLVLARIGNLQVRARTVVEGFLSGFHQSSTHGYSLEFAQHREYTVGDDLRHIDWKIYARSDRFFIKQYEQETNLKLQILIDHSGSMGFKGAQSAFSKYDYAATLAASLSYLTLKQGDSVGLGTLAAGKIELLPPRSSFSHLNILLEHLQKSRPQGETVLAKGIEQAAHSFKKRSLVVILSDALDQEESLLKALKLLRFKKNEVHFIHLLDPDEQEFPYSGNIEFESMEDSGRVTLEAGPFRKEYAFALQRWIEAYRTAARQSGIEYHFHTTDQPFDLVMRSLLKPGV